jgi:hypothetical protein
MLTLSSTQLNQTHLDSTDLSFLGSVALIQSLGVRDSNASRRLLVTYSVPAVAICKIFTMKVVSLSALFRASWTHGRASFICHVHRKTPNFSQHPYPFIWRTRVRVSASQDVAFPFEPCERHLARSCWLWHLPRIGRILHGCERVVPHRELPFSICALPVPHWCWTFHIDNVREF